MRLVAGWLTCAVLGGCAQTTFAPTDVAALDGRAEAGCQPGQTRCQANVWQTCIGGSWAGKDCGGQVCVEGQGCKVCQPEAAFCDGQDVYQCSADGNTRTKTSTCKDGEQCVLGVCRDMCQQAQKNRSNVGCEFWAVDLPNEYYCDGFEILGTCINYNCAACEQFAVAVANTNGFPVTVTIEGNDASPGEPLKLSSVAGKTIPASSLEVFNLPMREVDCTEWKTDAAGKLRRLNDSQTCVSSRAFRVKSSSPVVAYQFNPIINDFSNGASLLIPVNGLDTKYYVMGWPTANPLFNKQPFVIQEGMPDYSFLAVVGREEGTEVEIKVSHATQGSKDGKVPAAATGETIKIALGPFDVLNLNTFQDANNKSGDLTGSLVRASKPVAVFSGGQRAMVPAVGAVYTPPPPQPNHQDGMCCTEHIEQQMFPVSSLGSTFVVTRTPVRSKGIVEPDFYRVLGTRDNVVTNVTTNLPEFPKLALRAGTWVDFWATKDFTLEADSPVMVGQYAVRQDFLDQWDPPSGDPEFVVFAPFEQHRKDYMFLTPSTFDKDFVVIAAPRGAVVKLDGGEVSAELSPLCARAVVGKIKGTEYLSFRCPVQDGVHQIVSTSPVGIMVYGYYDMGSYGYPGGADVKQINID